jgi:hypothetical protein
MTKKKLARMNAIIRELTRLSRNGWRDARPSDYLPLERELKALLAERRREQMKMKK